MFVCLLFLGFFSECKFDSDGVGMDDGCIVAVVNLSRISRVDLWSFSKEMAGPGIKRRREV